MLKKIGIALLILVLATFNVIIGANEKGLRVLPISILLGFIIIYLVALKISNKKEKIVFKTKVDLLVLLFMLTTILPLIFGTYASYSDTVEFMIKYFFIYAVYLLARNSLKTKNQVECIVIATLICSLIPIIFQFDNIYTKKLNGLMKWLNITYKEGTEFLGTFGYANAQAIYLGFCIYLAIHRFIVNKKKFLKVIDIIYILFSMYIIWLTESKAVMLLLAISLFIIAIVKYRKFIAQNKIKIGVIIGVICISTITFLGIALNTYKPILSNKDDIDHIIKYRFKENTKYSLELDLFTNSEKENEEAFDVQILQGGKYFNESILASQTIGNTDGKFKIEFTPTKNINYVRVKIVNRCKGSISLDGLCYINGEKQILKYKYIPDEIGYICKGFLLNGKSLRQRNYIYQDSLKIAKDSLIVGHGGDAWKNLSRSIEIYTSSYKETHSYFLELLISYGIIGLIAFLVSIIYFFIKIFNECKTDLEKRKYKLLIAIGLFIVLFHSITFDFNMSFMIIQILVYIYIPVLLFDFKDEEISLDENLALHLLDYSIIIFLTFILSLCIRADISKYLIDDLSQKHIITPYKKQYYYEKLQKDVEKNIDTTDTMYELQDLIKKEPYFTQTENYEMYFNLINKYLKGLSNDELQNHLNFVINNLETVRFSTPMYIETIIYRTSVLTTTVKNFEKYIERNPAIADTEKEKILREAIKKIRNVIDNEYQTNIENIEDYDRNGYNPVTIKTVKEKYEQTINSIK